MHRMALILFAMLLVVAFVVYGTPEIAEEEEDYAPPRIQTTEELNRRAYDEALRNASIAWDWEEIRDQTKSPNGQWRCWLVVPMHYEPDQGETSGPEEIHIEKAGVEYQLDEPEGRNGWISKPVFSPDSRKLAVFESDCIGTGRIFIWSLPSGVLKIVEPTRGDLERIGFDKKGHIYISPEKHDYSYD